MDKQELLELEASFELLSKNVISARVEKVALEKEIEELEAKREEKVKALDIDIANLHREQELLKETKEGLSSTIHENTKVLQNIQEENDRNELKKRQIEFLVLAGEGIRVDNALDLKTIQGLRDELVTKSNRLVADRQAFERVKTDFALKQATLEQTDSELNRKSIDFHDKEMDVLARELTLNSVHQEKMAKLGGESKQLEKRKQELDALIANQQKKVKEADENAKSVQDNMKLSQEVLQEAEKERQTVLNEKKRVETLSKENEDKKIDLDLREKEIIRAEKKLRLEE